MDFNSAALVSGTNRAAKTHETMCGQENHLIDQA